MAGPLSVDPSDFPAVANRKQLCFIGVPIPTVLLLLIIEADDCFVSAKVSGKKPRMGTPTVCGTSGSVGNALRNILSNIATTS